MKGDGHTGGQLYLASKGKIAHQKFCKTDRKFILITLTSLDGQPAMCITIIQSSQVNHSSEVDMMSLCNQKVILKTVTSF